MTKKTSLFGAKNHLLEQNLVMNYSPTKASIIHPHQGQIHKYIHIVSALSKLLLQPFIAQPATQDVHAIPICGATNRESSDLTEMPEKLISFPRRAPQYEKRVGIDWSSLLEVTYKKGCHAGVGAESFCLLASECPYPSTVNMIYCLKMSLRMMRSFALPEYPKAKFNSNEHLDTKSIPGPTIWADWMSAREFGVLWGVTESLCIHNWQNWIGWLSRERDILAIPCEHTASRGVCWSRRLNNSHNRVSRPGTERFGALSTARWPLTFQPGHMLTSKLIPLKYLWPIEEEAKGCVCRLGKKNLKKVDLKRLHFTWIGSDIYKKVAGTHK